MPTCTSWFLFAALCAHCLLLPARVSGQVRQQLSSEERDFLRRSVDGNEVFGQAHTGFVLYDLGTGTQLYAYNADRRFVPASNVKLFTYYLAQRVLGNTAPAVFYQQFQDHYELWGTGYPLALHPEFLAEDLLTPWLRTRGKPLTLNYPIGEGKLPRYGSGWSWDDYDGGYVFERSTFPLFGNRLYLQRRRLAANDAEYVFASPPGFLGQLREVPEQRRRVHRSEVGNDFTVRPGYLPATAALQRSLSLSPYWMVNELNAVDTTLRATVGVRPLPPPGTREAFEVSLPDTVYRRFLQNSDNYLAEQLLLLTASKRYGYPDESLVLDYAVDTLLPTIGVENVRWADGSGLSRYSLFTPRHLARVVVALDQEVGRERLRSLLAEGGGDSGTLRRRFDGAQEPYVWAKTGSLSGVACVSGLLRTQEGRWLVFSFMHNNFVGGSGPYYEEMEKVLGWVYERM